MKSNQEQIKKKYENYYQLDLDNEIDIFNQDSFMLCASLDQDFLGEIYWCSQNTEDILKRSNNQIVKTQLNNIMPQAIKKVHDNLQVNYLKSGHSSNMHQKIQTYIIDYNQCLFTVLKIMKIYMKCSQIYQIAYIKKTNENGSIITNQYGMIDCFSEIFFKCTDLQYNFPFIHQNIPIFLFMPSLIVLYLKEFYQISDFKISNFDYQNFKGMYLFVFKNQEQVLLKLSKILQQNQKKGISGICTAMYEFYKQTQFESIQRSFYIEFEFIENNIQRKDLKSKFFEIKIKSVSKVVGLKLEEFTSQYAFIEKLKFDQNLLYSIERYQQRREDLMKMEQQQNLNSTIYYSFNCAQSNNKDQSNRQKQSQKQDKEIFTDKNSSNNISINDDHKERATRIIKKLFEKKFNPGGDQRKWSKAKRRWVEIINKHNSSKNQVRGTFIQQHIENIPTIFDETIFFKKPTDTLPTDYDNDKISKSSKKVKDFQQKDIKEQINQFQLQILEKNIYRNKWKKKVFFFFLFMLIIINFLLILFFKFFNISHQVEDLQIFEKENAIKVAQSNKTLSSIIYASSFFLFSQNQKYDIITDQERYQNEIQIENEKLDIILDLYKQSLKDYNIQSDVNTHDQYFSKFREKTTFNLLHGDEVQMTLEYFIKILNVKQSFQKKQTEKFIKNQTELFQQNQNTLFKKILDFHRDFVYQVDYSFEDLLEDKFKSSILILCQYMLVNFICLCILTHYLTYSNNIFYLMMKIEKSQVLYWRGYFRELNFQTKISQSCECLYDFQYNHKKIRQKKNRTKDLQIFNKRKYIWIFVSLLIFCLQIPVVLFEYKNQVKYIKELHINYKYYEQTIFYNLYQSMNNWIMISYIQQQKSINSQISQEQLDMINNIYDFQQFYINFKSIESIYFTDQNLIEFYQMYTENKVCEKLEIYKFCEYPEFQNIYSISFQIQLYENYFLLQKFRNLINQDYGWQNLNYNNLFIKQVKDNLFKSFGLYVVLFEFCNQQINQIDRAKNQIWKKAIQFFYFDILAAIMIFAIIYQILFRNLRKESTQNSSYINLIPIEILIKNQYFKISINKNQYQLIEKYKNIKFIKKRKRILLNTIKLKINRLKDTIY